MKKNLLVQWATRFAPTNPAFLPLKIEQLPFSEPQLLVPNLWIPAPCGGAERSLWFEDTNVTVNEAMKILRTSRSMILKFMRSGDLTRETNIDIMGEEAYGIRISLHSVLKVLFHGAFRYHRKRGIAPLKVKLDFGKTLTAQR